MAANGTLLPLAVRANPSRSRAANQSLASSAGAPTSVKRSAMGDISDRVSLTSKMMTDGVMGMEFSLVESEWVGSGLPAVTGWVRSVAVGYEAQHESRDTSVL